jgi:hypothetical protein
MKQPKWIPETDEEWRQLDEKRTGQMNSRFPFYLTLALALLFTLVFCYVYQHVAQ